MSKLREQLMDRAAGAVDLLIDFATLGEYGFEPVGAPGAGACEGAAASRVADGWEAFTRARRGGCRPGRNPDPGCIPALR
jgi:hypothetical protein